MYARRASGVFAPSWACSGAPFTAKDQIEDFTKIELDPTHWSYPYITVCALPDQGGIDYVSGSVNSIDAYEYKGALWGNFNSNKRAPGNNASWWTHEHFMMIAGRVTNGDLGSSVRHIFGSDVVGSGSDNWHVRLTGTDKIQHRGMKYGTSYWGLQYDVSGLLSGPDFYINIGQFQKYYGGYAIPEYTRAFGNGTHVGGDTGNNSARYSVTPPYGCLGHAGTWGVATGLLLSFEDWSPSVAQQQSLLANPWQIFRCK